MKQYKKKFEYLTWQSVWLREASIQDIPLYAFSELIDNSIAASYDISQLEICITINRDKHQIIYKDNAKGMYAEEWADDFSKQTKGTLNKALLKDTLTDNNNLINQFGYGLQGALGWLGKEYKIESKMNGKKKCWVEIKPDLENPLKCVEYNIFESDEEDNSPSFTQFIIDKVRNYNFTMENIFPEYKGKSPKDFYFKLASQLYGRYRIYFKNGLKISFNIDGNIKTICHGVHEFEIFNDAYIVNEDLSNKLCIPIVELKEKIKNINFEDNDIINRKLLIDIIDQEKPFIFNFDFPEGNGFSAIPVTIKILRNKKFSRTYDIFSGLEIIHRGRYIYSVPNIYDNRYTQAARITKIDAGGGNQIYRRINASIDLTNICKEQEKNENIHKSEKLKTEIHKRNFESNTQFEQIEKHLGINGHDDAGSLVVFIRQCLQDFLQGLLEIEEPDTTAPIIKNKLTIIVNGITDVYNVGDDVKETLKDIKNKITK